MKNPLHSIAGFLLLFTIAIVSTGSCYAASQYNVIILKFATHPALDELEVNFRSSLNAHVTNVFIETLNANGNPVSAKQLAESATRPGIDLIVTLATPASQAVAKTPSDIPLLYAAVSDPDGAHVVLPRSTGIQNVNSNIVKQALQTITNLYPKATRIGTIYNPTEQNSVFVQDLIKSECTAMNLILEQRTVSDPNQFPATVEQLRPQIDVLYCANDNLVNKGALSIARTAQVLKLPFVIGELSTVSKGAVAGIGVEYSSMGQHLGDLAAQILTRKPNDPLPPREPPPKPQFWLNMPVAKEIGLEIPQEILQKTDKILP